MSWLTANEPKGTYPQSWYAANADILPPFPPVAIDTRAEVCVIGGGFTGLSAALHLAAAGRDVILIEANRVGFGASGRNGGQIGSGYNWSQQDLQEKLGAKPARALWDISQAAKALVTEMIETHAPEAAYHPGIIHADNSRSGVKHSHADAEWLAQEYGYDQISPLNADEISAITGSKAHRGGTLDMGAGYCQPLAYALGLARAAAKAGARIHEGARVRKISGSGPYQLRTRSGTITADQVVLACNGYLDGLVGRVADHVMPINNYIAVTEPLGDRAPMTRPVAVADSRFVVNYWWQSSDGRLVYGGGESYGQKFPKDIVAKVRRNMSRVYPELRDVEFTHSWGGTLAVTATRLPYVAEVSPGLFSASGFSGHGVALASYSGKAMANKILGEGDEFDQLAKMPVPRLPGGRMIGPLVTGAGMLAYSLRDRLGF